MTQTATTIEALAGFLERGGPAMWAIAVLSVATVTLVLWKLWHLARLGVWSHAPVEAALAEWQAGRVAAARACLAGRRGLHARVARAAIETLATRDEGPAREETARVARAGLLEARRGLRALDLIATIAPLVGLLGTVLGMIEAFQALQEAGQRADPSALAGGIWQALLTTAAGMAVAIPAGVALSWFDSVTDAAQARIEDSATRLFLAAARTGVGS